MPVNTKSETKTRGCPPENVWVGVAAGLVPNSDAVVWIAHASECDPCAALLREALQDVGQDVGPNAALEPSAEDIAQIEPIDTPAWRNRMARMLSDVSGQRRAGTARQGGWRDWPRRPAR